MLPGIQAIKDKLKQEKLTVQDGLEVNEKLDVCCEVHPKCNCVKECDELNNKLSDRLPAYVPKLEGSKQGSENWIPQLNPRGIFRVTRDTTIY